MGQISRDPRLADHPLAKDSSERFSEIVAISRGYINDERHSSADERLTPDSTHDIVEGMKRTYTGLKPQAHPASEDALPPAPRRMHQHDYDSDDLDEIAEHLIEANRRPSEKYAGTPDPDPEKVPDLDPDSLFQIKRMLDRKWHPKEVPTIIEEATAAAKENGIRFSARFVRWYAYYIYGGKAWTRNRSRTWRRRQARKNRHDAAIEKREARREYLDGLEQWQTCICPECRDADGKRTHGRKLKSTIDVPTGVTVSTMRSYS